MTTWTDIANGDVDQDSPATQPLLTALRDNPKAIAEGSENAPKVVSAAMNLSVHTASLNAASAAVEISLTREQRFLVLGSTAASGSGSNSNSATVRYRTSDDGGSTWSGYTTFLSFSGSGDNPHSGRVVEELDLGVACDTLELSATRSSGSYSTAADLTLLAIGGTVDP